MSLSRETQEMLQSAITKMANRYISAEESKVTDFHIKVNGENGELIISRKHGGNLGSHDIGAGKLMGAGVDAQCVAHVCHAACFLIKTHIAFAVNAAQCHGEQVATAAVFCQQIPQGNVGEDIAVVNDEGALFPERENFFHAAAGVQRFVLVAKGDGATAVLRVGAGESLVPGHFKGGGVDDELCDPCLHKVVHGVLNERFLKDRHQRFGEDESEGL